MSPTRELLQKSRTKKIVIWRPGSQQGTGVVKDPVNAEWHVAVAKSKK